MKSGRPPKTLTDHVRDGSFRASRYAALLERDPLDRSAPPTLQQLQADYQKSPWPRIRAAIAVQFEELLRRRRDPRRVLTRQQVHFAQQGPYAPSLPARLRVSLSRWLIWDVVHGAEWRRLHDIPLSRDLKRHPFRPDDEMVAQWLRQHNLNPNADSPPDPPGWHRLA